MCMNVLKGGEKVLFGDVMLKLTRSHGESECGEHTRPKKRFCRRRHSDNNVVRLKLCYVVVKHKLQKVLQLDTSQFSRSASWKGMLPSHRVVGAVSIIWSGLLSWTHLAIAAVTGSSVGVFKSIIWSGLLSWTDRAIAAVTGSIVGVFKCS